MDIDIHSSTFNKFLDLAKDFIGPLIKPTIEELGLLSKERVAAWRLRNQVKTLVKAKELCEEKGINPGFISVKVLTPLLDNIALEEEDYLQGKWAYLIANLLDTSKNIQNHVLPNILSQMSSNEFQFLEHEYLDQEKRIGVMQKDYAEYEIEYLEYEKMATSKISDLDKKLDEDLDREVRDNILNERNSLSWELSDKRRNLDQKEAALVSPIELKINKVEKVELINLTRLGLVKVEQRTVSVLSNSGLFKFARQSGKIDISSVDERHYFSELGIYLVEVCTKV